MVWQRRAAFRRDLLVALIVGAMLLAWDATGWDLAVMRRIGTADGFALQQAWWTSRVLHDGGRTLAWGLLGALALNAAWCSWHGAPPGSPPAAERWRWIGVMLLVAVAVPALKRISHTSCPWDLQAFGGVASHVSHWRWGRSDGGPGHCFPSGHAVAAFAFFGLHFLWRPQHPVLARRLLATACAAGLLFGSAQTLRGAHHPSHTLWTAWISWVICLLAARWMPATR